MSYTRPHDAAVYGGGGSSGDNYYDPTADFSHAVSHASQHRRDEKYGHGGGESDDEEASFFSKAIGYISEHKDSLKKEDVNEDMAVGAHQDLYGGGDGGTKSHSAESLGSGAAVQALKMFTGHGGHGGGGGGGGGGTQDQNKLIGMAMAQAGKLWDQKNKEGKATTDKQSAVNSAAKHALQMYMKGNHGPSGTGGMGGLASKLAGASGHGGGGHGGAADLLNAAKKFL